MSLNQPAPPAPPPPNLGLRIPGVPFDIEPLHWLLLAFPVAVVFKLFHISDLWLFIFACAALIPLAGLMGRATENLAETMGAGIGGLLNATFGNAAELIIALFALFAGKYALVKASLTGSIMGNVLLVLGLSIVAGGFFYKKQTFNRTAASMGATLLGLAAIALLIPTLYYLLLPAGHDRAGRIGFLSEELAVVLALVYLLNLFFSLRTHQHLFAREEGELPTTGPHHEPEWDRRTSLTILLLATALVAVTAEFVVSSVERAAHALAEAAGYKPGDLDLFIGVIVVAVIGNAAEHSTAVLVAMKNKMDLAVTIAIGSSIQVALFVAPVLVFASLLTGHGILDLHFTGLEVAALVITIAVVALIAQDGETHWMEGVMLLAVYVMLAFAFFHFPEAQNPASGH